MNQYIDFIKTYSILVPTIKNYMLILCSHFIFLKISHFWALKIAKVMLPIWAAKTVENAGVNGVMGSPIAYWH